MRVLLWPRYDGIHPTCALVLGVWQKRLKRVTTMRWWPLVMESTPWREHGSMTDDAKGEQVAVETNDLDQ